MVASTISTSTTAPTSSAPTPAPSAAEAIYPATFLVDTAAVPSFASDTCGFIPTRECNATCPRTTLTQSDAHRAFSVLATPRCICGPPGTVAPYASCVDRVNLAAHPAQYAFDGDPATTWQATRGLANVTLAIDLEAVMEVVSVRYHLPGLLPHLAVLEASLDGVSWRTALHFATNCPSAATAASPCIQVAVIELAYTASLRIPPITARFLQLRFLEFSQQATLQNRVHAVSDTTIIARQHCNGHAASVDSTGRCECRHDTTGPTCDGCLPLSNRKPWQPANATSANSCLPCNCNANANECTYNAALDTAPGTRDTGDGGVCQCLNATAGQDCSACIYGAFHAVSGQCEPCDCHATGTEQATADSCSPVDGQCACRPSASGRRCDQCPTDTFGPSSAVEVCTDCNCSTSGSASPSCDVETGVCPCLDGYTGLQCRGCDVGHYSAAAMVNASAVQCASCHPLCSECSGPGDSRQVCSRCAAAKNATHCVASCPLGAYADGLQRCQPCSNECDIGCSAAGPSVVACTACRHVAFNGVCVSECPPLHYTNEIGVCEACSDQCYGGCRGSGPANCTSCRHFIEAGACAPTCSRNTYNVDADMTLGSIGRSVSSMDGMGDASGSGDSGSGSGELDPNEVSAAQQCLFCSTTCDGCIGPGLGSCVGCATALARIEVWDPFSMETAVHCAAACPLRGFFEAAEMIGSDSVRTCTQCHPECAAGLCNGASARNCTSCNSYEFEGECVPTCPAGTYVASGTRQCLPCADTCLWCDGPLATDCPVCGDGFLFRPNHGCVVSCGLGEYIVGGACQSCGIGCTSCDSPYTCATCSTNNSLYNSICVPDVDCPILTVADNGRCEPCSDQCLDACTGPTAMNCTRCRFVDLDGTCTSGCPDDAYPAALPDGSQRCDDCSEECAVGCDGPSAFECTACATFTNGAECVAACPNGTTFARGSDCVSCHPQCEAGTGCTGPLASDCAGSCDNALLVVESSVANCVAECPDRYFEHPMSRICVECEPECLECTGNGTSSASSDGCTTCSTFTLGSECLLQCSIGTYGASNGSCLACDTQCANACFGPSPSHCGEQGRTPTHTDCVGAIRDTTCVAACNTTTEYQQSQAEPLCQLCHHECLGGCGGPDASQCTECQAARLGRTCVSSCPVGMAVIDPGTGVCVNCHPECAQDPTNATQSTCFGTTSSDCTGGCAHFSRQGRCVGNCDASTEFVSSARQCLSCHPNCGSDGCIGPGSSACVTCRAYTMPNGDCAAACPIDYFANPGTMECQPCSLMCTIGRGCPLGTGSNHCVECNAFQDGRVCVATCPNNTFVAISNISGTVEQTCTLCHASCHSAHGCTGPLPFDCNRCSALELVQAASQPGGPPQTVCVESCPRLHYRNGAQCFSCNANCLSGCNGGAATNCTAASSQPTASATDLGCRTSALISATGIVECVVSCGVSRFRDLEGLCRPCSSSCGSVGCVGPSPANCTQCPSMQHLDPTTGRCVACSSECAVGCSGPSAAECVSCRNVNAEGVCLPSCATLNGSHYRAASVALGDVCARCSTQCATGSGCTGGTDADCGSCRSVQIRASGRCAGVCPDATFVNSSVCEPCHPSCDRTCSGPMAADCIDCRGVLLRSGLCGDQCNPNEALAANGRCFCPIASAFVDNVTTACTACDDQCANGCDGTGAQHCGASGCRSGIQTRDGRCVDRCPLNEMQGLNGVCSCPNMSAYMSLSGTCLACDSECAAGCSGGANTECIGFPSSCNHVYEAVSTRCLATCPAGSVATDDGAGNVACVCPSSSYYGAFRTCEACAAECATCSGPGVSRCTACRGFANVDGQCAVGCGNNTFMDVTTRRCTQCDVECVGSCSRPEDPTACLDVEGRRCRHVHDPVAGCTESCSSTAPFLDVTGQTKVCRASCPLGKPFRNDTRGIPTGQLEGILCVASCSEIVGTVINIFTPEGDAACSPLSVEAMDALAATPIQQDESAAGMSTTTIVAIALCCALLVLMVALFSRHRAKSGSTALDEPPMELDQLGAEPISRLPAHMSSIHFSPSYQNPYGQFAMTPQIPQNIDQVATPGPRGYVSAYMLAQPSGVMETPL